MSKVIYLITGRCGEYSSLYEWNVKAFYKKENAEKYKKLLEKELLSAIQRNDGKMIEDMRKIDKYFNYCHFAPTEYHITELEYRIK